MDLERVQVMTTSEVHTALKTALTDDSFRRCTADYALMKRYCKYGQALFQRLSVISDSKSFEPMVATSPDAADDVPTLDMNDLSLTEALNPHVAIPTPITPTVALIDRLPIVRTDPASEATNVALLGWEFVLSSYVTPPNTLPVRRLRDPEAAQPDALMTRLRLALRIPTAAHCLSADLLSIAPVTPVMSVGQPLRAIAAIYQILAGDTLSLPALNSAPFGISINDISINPNVDVHDLIQSPIEVIQFIQRQIALLVTSLQVYGATCPDIIAPILPPITILDSLILPVLNPPMDPSLAVTQASAVLPRFQAALPPLLKAASQVLQAMAMDPTPPAPPGMPLPYPPPVVGDIYIPMLCSMLVPDFKSTDGDFDMVCTTLMEQLMPNTAATVNQLLRLSAIATLLDACPPDASTQLQRAACDPIVPPGPQVEDRLQLMKDVTKRATEAIAAVLARHRKLVPLAIGGVNIIGNIAQRHSELVALTRYLGCYVVEGGDSTKRMALWGAPFELDWESYVEESSESTKDLIMASHRAKFEEYVTSAATDDKPAPSFKTKLGGSVRSPREQLAALDQWERGKEAECLSSVCQTVAAELRVEAELFLPSLDAVWNGVGLRVLYLYRDLTIQRVSDAVSRWTMTSVSLPHVGLVGTQLGGLVEALDVAGCPTSELPSAIAVVSSAVATWLSQQEDRLVAFINRVVAKQVPVNAEAHTSAYPPQWRAEEAFTIQSSAQDVVEVLWRTVNELIAPDAPLPDMSEHLLDRLARMVRQVLLGYIKIVDKRLGPATCPNVGPLWTNFAAGAVGGLTRPNASRGRTSNNTSPTFKTDKAIEDLSELWYTANGWVEVWTFLEELRGRVDGIWRGLVGVEAESVVEDSMDDLVEVEMVPEPEPEIKKGKKDKKSKKKDKKDREKEKEKEKVREPAPAPPQTQPPPRPAPRGSLALTFIRETMSDVAQAIDRSLDVAAARLVYRHLRTRWQGLYCPSATESEVRAGIVMDEALSVLETADGECCNPHLADVFGNHVLVHLSDAFATVLLDSGPRMRVITQLDAKTLADDVRVMEAAFMAAFGQDTVLTVSTPLRDIVRVHALPSHILMDGLTESLGPEGGAELDMPGPWRAGVSVTRARVLNFRRYSGLAEDKKVRGYLHSMKTAVRKG